MANPKEFVKPSRIDIIPKIWYVKNKKRGINADFFVKMYLEHIKAFNHFNENHKRTPEDFLRDFDNLIESINKNGFKKEKGLIPISKNSTAIDGSHRLATSVVFDKNVAINKSKSSDGPNYNYNYFRKRGLSENILEEIIFRYFKFKEGKNLTVCLFWGSSIGKLDKGEIKKELGKEGIEIVYSKEAKLTEKGKRNLIISCYENEPWIDKENNFSGALRKVAPCFKDSNKVEFYLLESDNKEDVIKFKKKIRERLNLGNHSIHSSDSIEEARNLCDIFLNKNSLFYLNHGYKMILPKELDTEELKERIDFVITSSYILEMFGIRKAEDIDYIIDNDLKIKELGSWHNEYFSEDGVKELIYNPANFFRFKGIKFLNLENIKEFKEKRGESKDKRDVLLIEKFLDKRRKFDFNEKVLIVKMKGVSLVLKFIKKIPQETRDKLKKNKVVMPVYRRLFT
ncbi:MAG: hypothetical protein WDZ62_02195 [Candidatus Pacearchaeota archaeon]